MATAAAAPQKTLNTLALGASTIDELAQSLRTTGHFKLGHDDRGIVADRINEFNPLAFYSSGLQMNPGSGSMEVTYKVYNTAFAAKEGFGNNLNNTVGTLADDKVGHARDLNGGKVLSPWNEVQFASEFFRWNQPKAYSEAIMAHDLKRGLPNVLSERASTNIKKFTKDSIKDSFKALVTQKGTMAYAIDQTGATTNQDKGLQILTQITDVVTRLASIDTLYVETDVNNKIVAVQKTPLGAGKQGGQVFFDMDESDFLVTIDPIVFNHMANAGVIGDRATYTVAGGKYSMGTANGITFVSGQQYLPKGALKLAAVATVDVPQAIDGTTSTGTQKALAYIGTKFNFVHGIDMIAYNGGNIEMSNDQGTYLEMADIAQPTFFSTILGAIIVDGTSAPKPVPASPEPVKATK